MGLIEMKWHTDEKGNAISINKQEDIQVSPTTFEVVLDEIPNEFKGIEVTDEESNYYVEVSSLDKVGNKTYYVDYVNGIVKFDSSLAGKILRFNYFGKGYKRISASRIITQEAECEVTPSTIKRLSDMIEYQQKQIDFLIEEMEKLILTRGE